ncbi:hypothetical protein Tco_1299208 [Tanacetum coccineum]
MERTKLKRKMNKVRQSANIAIHLILLMSNLTKEGAKCKAKKFEAIQYSLGPNEEYIAIRGYEFDIWERNEDNLSIIYQDIFQKKDEGWKDLGSKEISTNVGGEFTNMEILKCWSLETLRRLFNTILLNKHNMENLPSKYQGSFSF